MQLVFGNDLFRETAHYILTYNFPKKYRKPNSKQNCQILLKIDFQRVIVSNKITTDKKSLIR